MKMDEFYEFTRLMKERLDANDKKYGDTWLREDMLEFAKEEVLDLANYAYLQYRKLCLLQKKGR